MAEINERTEERKIPSILDKITILPSDRVLGIIIALLFVISLIVVYSSSAQLAYRHNLSTEIFLKKHLLTLLGTAVLMLIAYFIPAKIVRALTPLAYTLSLLATIAAYFIGNKGDDALRSLDLGFISFHPSELLKIATVMVLAIQLSKRNTELGKTHLLPATLNVKRWWQDKKHRAIITNEVLPIVAPIAISCAVILPAHTSSTLILFLISMLMLYVAGIRKVEIGKLVLAAMAVGLPIMFLFGRGDTVGGRIGRFLDSEEVNYKIHTIEKYSDSYRSQMAMHNGGLFGVGAGRSVMRGRLTRPESDYLFAIIVEELGSFIAFIVILLYLWIFFRALRIFDKCTWLYAGLLVVGLALLLTIQAFLHIGVALGSIPETGQNLPFLTQGRTSMFVSGIIVGMILGVSRQAERGTLVPPGKKSEARINL